MIVRKHEVLPWPRIIPAAGEIVQGRKYCSNQAMLIKRECVVS
jgi:alkylated DNA nucleotide flippase Atl1